MFGNLRNIFELVRKRSCGLRALFVETTEIFEKSTKTSLAVCLHHNKQNNTWLLVDVVAVFTINLVSSVR